MTTTTTPIPIFVCGKHLDHQEAVKDIVQPEYEVIGQAYSLEETLEKLPSFLADKKIQLAVMGGGFTPADFERTMELPGAKGIPWLRPVRPKMEGGGGGAPPQAPPADVVAGRVKRTLGENLDAVKGGGGSGQVWLF